MGMHDEEFHSYHEDSDIFNRFLLNGMKLIQSRDALVYHLTCRGGKWIDGIEQVTTDTKFHDMTIKARNHYLKKWGCWIQNDEYQHPILKKVMKARKKYNAHDENNKYKVGDNVFIRESRPFSKNKKFEVIGDKK